MKQITSIIIATVIVISASAASASCDKRSSSGLFAHTKATSSVVSVKTTVTASASTSVKSAR